MSVVTIWEPRRYVDGFDSMQIDQGNGTPQTGLKGRDTKVAEVPKFTGETVQRYNRAGEMALELYGVRPSDVSHRYLLELDGRHYLIERIEWSDHGNVCSVEGRSVEAYLDMEYDCFDMPGRVYGSNTPASQLYSTQFQRIWFLWFMAWFMGQAPGTGTTFPPNGVTSDYPAHAGWWRDAERFSVLNGVKLETVSTENRYAAEGTGIVREFMTWGAHLRSLCALFGYGYRWDMVWNEDKGLHEVTFVVYDRGDAGIVIGSNDAGVSEFTYSQDSRDICNTVAYCYKDHVSALGVYDPDGDQVTHYGMTSRTGFLPDASGPGDVLNACEMAEHMHMDFVDLGAVPEKDGDVQIDGDAGQTAAWVRAQLLDKTDGMFGGIVEDCAFNYDGRGRYRYGVHFELGSRIGLVDDRTGYAATQVLTEVTTRYKGGSQFPSYAFKFGDRRRTTADKILGRFQEVNRRTSSY